MKIEISTQNSTINSLFDRVEKVVEELDHHDAHEIQCGFFFIEMIGDLIDYVYENYL